MRARMPVCVRARVRVSMCVCVCARARVRACISVCVCARARAGERPRVVCINGVDLLRQGLSDFLRVGALSGYIIETLPPHRLLH